jgi:hypothetical protein
MSAPEASTASLFREQLIGTRGHSRGQLKSAEVSGSHV